MPGVLTTGSTISCTQAGTVTAASNAKLKVNGESVLLKNQVSTWTVGCPPPNPKCVSANPPSAGVSTKLKVQGSAVLLATLQATGKPSGHAITAKIVQIKLTAS
jgi:hypothetical protein